MKNKLSLFDVPTIQSVQQMVVQSARKYDQKTALLDLKKTPLQSVTYNSLLHNVLAFGSAVKKLGLKERSHVAIIGENRVQWAVSYLMGMCFNYVVVPIDRNLTVNEILNIIHESESEAIIFSEQFESVLRERQSSLKKLRFYIGMDLPAMSGDFYSMSELIKFNKPFNVDKLPSIKPDEVAEIIFTSGSLGRAKAVMLSQKNLASNLMSMVEMFFIYPEDRFLSVLPMHHTYECTCGMLCPLFAGASVYYARSLKTIVEDLQETHATIILGVPLLYEKMFKRIYKTINEKKVTATLIQPLIKTTGLLQKLGWKSAKRKVFGEIHKKFGGAVRCFIAGGAAPDPLVAKGLREFGFAFVQGYGLTETSPILTLNRLDNFKDDAAGLPLPGVELAIDSPDEDGIGEVLAKGPNIMLGYYKNESATKETFSNGWFKTGDLGKIDRDGFLHISGRKKNVIISNSGKNVFPEEVEDILLRSPFVLEAFVYGEKDAKHDEIIAAQIVVDAEAFIELSESRGISITPQLLHEVIAEEVQKTNRQLASYKQIRKFYIRDQEFEKTTTQKIKRYLVEKQ
jgi:long-chain acyl-CoA synthetase